MQAQKPAAASLPARFKREPFSAAQLAQLPDSLTDSKSALDLRQALATLTGTDSPGEEAVASLLSNTSGCLFNSFKLRRAPSGGAGVCWKVVYVPKG